MRVAFCESCGVPMEAPWDEIVVVCRHCGGQNAPGPHGHPVPSSTPDDGRPRLHAGGRTYVIEGKLGSGDATEVYRARWVQRLGELVVIKVLRHLGDRDLLRREWTVIESLRHSAAQGTAHFSALLPQPISLGLFHDGALERLIAVYRWKSGFIHTVEDIHEVHGGNVPGPVLVWMANRLLELLTRVHTSGRVHGAVLPGHILVHPRDHGATLLGWSLATRTGEPLRAIPAAMAHVAMTRKRAQVQARGLHPDPVSPADGPAWA